MLSNNIFHIRDIFVFVFALSLHILFLAVYKMEFSSSMSSYYEMRLVFFSGRSGTPKTISELFMTLPVYVEIKQHKINVC